MNVSSDLCSGTLKFLTFHWMVVMKEIIVAHGKKKKKLQKSYHFRKEKCSVIKYCTFVLQFLVVYCCCLLICFKFLCHCSQFFMSLPLKSFLLSFKWEKFNTTFTSCQLLSSGTGALVLRYLSLSTTSPALSKKTKLDKSN